MTYPKQRAYIGIEQEKKISNYSTSLLYRGMKRAELAKLIQDQVKWPGKPPELEVLEKKITEYRGKSNWDDDKLWCLGESSKAEYGIQADATGILLELWRYSLEIGYPLTFRHAKWVARLHKVIVTASNDLDHWKQIQTLFFATLLYADQERVSQMLQQERFDTLAEDIDLIIPFIEAMALRAFDVLPLSGLVEIPTDKDKNGTKERITKRTKGGLFDIIQSGNFNVALIVHILHSPERLDESPELDDDKVFDKFYGRCYEIETTVERLSVEQQRAYAILVTCFSKGPKWDDLSPKDYLKIIERFAQLVSQYSGLDQILRLVIFDKENTFGPYFRKIEVIPPLDNIRKMLGLPEPETEA